MKAFLEIERAVTGKVAVVVVDGVGAKEAEDLALILWSMDPDNKMFTKVSVGVRAAADQVYQVIAMGAVPHDLRQLYQTALRIEGTLRLPQTYPHFTVGGKEIRVTVPE